ncbi:hypothetical protein [Anaerobiospirillum thomasii]|uniref:DUF4352 domain-containing protein n=1 Tax=Anaerobiospirillum thomasii TaxID=179995 RepID=A0A2X0V9C7_9GAMM|nr:hypothetical protein [Anaerobiospirillum thomasii]SPT69736.1 Uncharacterised protein [Anaerobiospirillum thomasii]
MKRLVVVLGLLVCMGSYAEEESGVVKAVSSVVSGVVSTGKDVLKGVKEGIDTGRKEGTSVDDAFIIDDKELFEKNVDANVLSVTQDQEIYKLTVGFKNKTDKLIRITNLNEQESLQLINTDGFTVFALDYVQDISIPKQSAVKATFIFTADGTPKTLKIYESEIEVPEEAIK